MEDMTVIPSGYDFGVAHAALRRYVDENILSGVSSAVLVGRDLVDLHCVGWADKEAQTPLNVDHIFRVFSNTKLVTSCAALLLFEEGRFELDDPVERFIPQLANPRVLRQGATVLDDTEPARGPITIRQLMSHSSGLTNDLLDPGTIICKAYNERNVGNPATTLAEMVDVLGQLPLVFHPGTSWEYSVATDVIGRLVEIVSGQRFDTFIRSRILDPLGMVDTGFVVPEQNRHRLSAYYAGADLMNPMQPGLTRTDDSPYPGAYLRPVPRLDAGQGLVSTLPDMMALVRSLLPGGPTLLKPDTINLMLTNQLQDGVWVRFAGFREIQGRGFGLAGGLVVKPSRLDHHDSTGELHWGGIAGTQWWISRNANVAGLLMTQRQMAFAHPFAFEFKKLAYQAVSRAP
jgi:CubicO group peptidase (beta-lactamase class C family)